MITFEWDENKNKINKLKHGVDFIEAISAFYDNKAILFDDPDHSEDEARFLLIGISKRTRLLIISHCYRDKDEVIRIISARIATRTETDYYVQSGGEL
ncbi:MAG: BrnT family toxin [Clostridiales bacterium]|nr:BrnT family toxin [Clostridiales bacterium]